MKIIYLNLCLVLVFFSCGGCAQTTEMELELTETPGTMTRYYCQIEPFEKKGAKLKTMMLREWEVEIDRKELVLPYTAKKLITLEDYQLAEKGDTILIVRDDQEIFKTGMQYLVRLFQGDKNELIIDQGVILNIPENLENKISTTNSFTLLTMQGRQLKLQYTFTGRFNCSQESFIDTMIKKGLDLKFIEEKIKAAIRKIIGRYREAQVLEKINDNTLVYEIIGELTFACFELRQLQVEVK